MGFDKQQNSQPPLSQAAKLCIAIAKPVFFKNELRQVLF